MSFNFNLLNLLVCLSVHSSIGVYINGVDDSALLQYPYDVPELNNDVQMPTFNRNEEVCDKAVALQNILGVMISMLRQDLSENTKASYILDSLKNLLRNTPGYNYEVIQKIDDLILTLDKYKDSGYKHHSLRLSQNKTNNPMNLLVRQSLQPNQNIKLGYELPALTNSYCTEALLSIVKIAYQAYASLAKNPICNLSGLPSHSGVKPVTPGLEETGEWDTHFDDIFNSISVGYKPVYESSLLPFPPNPNLYPTNNINNNIPIRPYLPQTNNILSFDYTPYPINSLHPDHPSAETYQENNPQESIQYPLPLNYSPDENNPLYIQNAPLPSSWSERPYFPSVVKEELPFPNSPKGNPVDVVPEYLLPKYKKLKRPLLLSLSIPNKPNVETPEHIPFEHYLSDDTNPPAKPDVFVFPASLKPDLFSFDYNPPYPLNSVYPYNPVAEPNPDTNSHGFTFGVKPMSLPLNDYSLDTNNPLYNQNHPVPYTSGERPDLTSLKPFFQSLNNPKNIPHITILDHPLTNKLPNQPETGTPGYFPLESYSSHNTYSLAESDVFEFPYKPASPKPDLFSFDYIPPYPVNSVYPYNPVVEPNPDTNSHGFTFGAKPMSLPLNDYSPDVNNPLYNQNHPVPYTWGERPDLSSLKPLLAILNNPKNIPQVMILDHPLPKQPETETPGYLPLEPYSSVNFSPPAEPDVYEFPYEQLTPKPNKWSPYLFPVDSQKNHANIPSAADENSSEAPLYPNIPNFKPSAYFPSPNPSSSNWIPEAPSAVIPQNVDSLFPEPDTQQNVLQVPISQMLVFIEYAVAYVEKTIPVGQFDEPTLYIIARIKSILARKEIEVDEYATIEELYMKLINYIKLLHISKEIIDLLDLSRVTNGSEWKVNKVVEFTYLVKRPRPVVYYPYYYVKYRLPYQSFMTVAQKLLREKPDIRTNPHELYEKLLALSKVVETSPDLESYDKKQIMELTSDSGSLIDAQLIRENGTLSNQLNILRDITSQLTVDDIFDPNEDATNQNELLSTDFKMVENHADDQNGMNPSTEANLEFTSFDSDKLRSDILRGENVGLPFSGYSLPTNGNPLRGVDKPKSKDQSHISPIMRKLKDATSDATHLRESNQLDLINSGNGLVNHDNEIIAMNTGNGNTQKSVNFLNPTTMINSVVPDERILKSSRTKVINNQQNLQNSVSRQNLLTQQQNFYNSGLVNVDNQKILMNTGTENRQDNVNILNPKMIHNTATSFHNNAITKPSQAHDNSLELINNPFTEKQYISNTDSTQLSLTTEHGLDMPHVSATESSSGLKSTSGMSIKSHINKVAGTQPSSDYKALNKDELANFIKTSVKEDFRQFYNTDTINNLPSTGERNKQNLYDFSYHNYMRPSDEITRPYSSHDFSNIDLDTFLATAEPNNQLLVDVNKMGHPNQDRVKLNAKVLNRDTRDKNAVSFNQNNLLLNPEFEYLQGIDNFDFDTGSAGQENYSGINQQNVAFDNGMTSQQSAFSQQHIANFWTDPRLSGQQIRYLYRLPIYYKYRAIQGFPVMSSAMPFLGQYSARPRPIMG